MIRFYITLVAFAVSCAMSRDSDTVVPKVASVVFSDADNYCFIGSLDVAGQTVAEMTNVFFSWTAVTQDVYGNAIGGADSIYRAEILNFVDLGWQEVLDGIQAGTFLQSDVDVFAYCTPQDTSCYLDDFVLGAGHPLTLSENFVQGSGTWLLRLDTRDSPEAVAELFLVPSAKSSETMAIVSNASSVFNVESEIKSVSFSSQSDLIFDWSALSVDGAGQSWEPSDADRIVLGRFDNGADGLGMRPYFFSSLADASWSADLSSETSIHLSDLSNAYDQAPDFISASSTWALALFSGITDPNWPRFLVVLKPK